MVEILNENNKYENKMVALRKTKEYISAEEYMYEVIVANNEKLGEEDTLQAIKSLDVDMKVIQDLTISYEGINISINFLLFTSKHCYIVKCFNTSEKIYVDSDGTFVSYYFKKLSKFKEIIDSPISKLGFELEMLKKLILKNNDNLISKLDLNDYFIPIVIFTNKKSKINMSRAPIDIKHKVIVLNKLEDSIKELERDSKYSLNSYTLNNICNYLVMNNAFYDYSIYYSNRLGLNR